MDEQDAEGPDVSATPINVDRHKTHDPNRNPDTHIKLPAAKQRDNAMKDAPKTTVLMCLTQFHADKLHKAAADFDEVQGGDAYAHAVWFDFQKAFGLLPDKTLNKKAWDNPPEQKVSDVWEQIDATHHFVPNHFLNISGNHYETTDESLCKIDGSFIHESDRKAVIAGYPNWPEMRFLVEFKRGGIPKDPFDDLAGHDPDASAKTRKEIRGQIMAYAERFFSYQHRHAAFFLFVNGDKFRVMCWDRSGVAVTEAVDYITSMEGTRALLEVTYAFSKLSRVKQGVDTTATRLLEGSCGWKRMDALAKSLADDLDVTERLLEGEVHKVFANPEEAATYALLSGDDDTELHSDPTRPCPCDHATSRRIIPVLSHVRRMFRESLVKGFPRYRLTVAGHDYLVGKHIFIGSGMIGRGTRGYVALEWKTQRFVFLKDSWRAYYEGVESEGTILSKLNQKKVLNVPTVVRHSDVFHPIEDDDVEEKPQSSGDAAGVELGSPRAGTGEEGQKTVNQPVGKETIRTPRLQETVNARYHPKRGKDLIDTNLPPYLVKEPSVHERWVAKGVEQPKTKKKKGSASDELPDRDPTSLLPEGPASAPPGRAFPNGSTTASKVVPPSTPQNRGTKRTFATMLARDQGAGLRHLVHTRLVVEEICLPLTAFTNSMQLVRIIYHCIVAHGLAWKDCRYMHRDVSAGNLLIYPHVRRTADGKYRIYWQGILSDWELAKHVSKTVAMQPQRTGTWHFMSAYLLGNPGMPTTIADELEAFLHVLVYGLVRRVRSNLSTIQKFLDEYFAGCSPVVETERVSCPVAKRESVVIGAALVMSNDPVVFSTPGRELVEGHPVNQLIAELLKVFHSRYVVLDWQNRPKEKAREGTPTRKGLPTIVENDPFLDDDPDTSVDESASPEDEPKVTEPTPQQFANAAALDDHKKIKGIFLKYLKDKVWPRDDVIPDRQNEVDASVGASPVLVVVGASKSEDASVNKAETVEPKEPEDIVMRVDDAKAEGEDLAVSGALKPEDAILVNAETVELKEPEDVVMHPVDATAGNDLAASDVPEPEGVPVDKTEVADALKTGHALVSSELFQFQVHDADAHDDATAAQDPSLERPTKRRRKGPLVVDPSTQRVTRSRTAANAAAVLVPAAVAPIAALDVPTTTAVQTSTMLTRSKTGKLPAATGQAKAAAPSGPPTRRATSRRSATAARTASGANTRRRSAAATTTEGTRSQTTGRRTRSRRS